MRLKYFLLSAAVLLATVLTARADTFSTFTLTDVTFQSGAVGTGGVVINTSTGVAQSFNVIYTLGPFTELFNTIQYAQEVPGVALYDFQSESLAGDVFDFNIGIITPVGYIGGPVCSLADPCLGDNDVGAYIPKYGRFDEMETGALDLTSSYTTGATPEPSSLVLFGTGALGLAASLRRKLFA